VLRYICLICFLSFFLPVESQDFFRIKTDFTIKSKAPSGQQQLTVGKVFYDKNIKQIVYEISFPEKEVWVQKDTTLYKIVGSKVIAKQGIPTMIEFTIYHLILNGNLADYGLKNTRFTITKVEKIQNSVISTWEPPTELKKIMGNVLISNINQQLDGIVFKNTNGEVLSKQFFRNYIKIKGLSIPQEIIRENYINGQKAYEVTTFTKTLINDYSGENIYGFKIPSE